MSDDTYDEILKSYVRSLKEIKKEHYETRGWQVPWAIEETIQAVWGKKEMKPKLVWPERFNIPKDTLTAPKTDDWKTFVSSIKAESWPKLKDGIKSFYNSLKAGLPYIYLPALKTSYGWCFIFYLPPGYEDSDLLDQEGKFYTAVGHRSLHFEIKGEAIFLHVMGERLQDLYAYEIGEVPKDYEIPFMVGVTYHKKPFYVDLAKSPHCIIWGPTGLGKSTLLRCFLTALIMTRPDVNIVILDIKGVDFQFAENYAEILNEIDDIEAALDFLLTELHRRKRILIQARCEDTMVYNERNPENRLEFYVVVIDEFTDIALLSKKAVAMIDRLIRMGRYVGISVVICSQRTTSDVSSFIGSIKMNCNLILAYHLNATNSNLLLESNKASIIPEQKGRGVVSWENQLIEYQGMKLTTAQATKLLANIPAKKVKKIGGKSTGAIPPRQECTG